MTNKAARQVALWACGLWWVSTLIMCVACLVRGEWFASVLALSILLIVSVFVLTEIKTP